MLRANLLKSQKPILTVSGPTASHRYASFSHTSRPIRFTRTHDKRSLSISTAIAQPSSTSESRDSSMAKTDFPIPPEKLIKIAQKMLLEDELGKHKPELLADDFKFEFPIIKLDKEGYLKAVRTFDFESAFPNYAQNAYDWRVDKYEPQRVWFTIRTTGTHLKDLKIFNKYTYKATGKEVYGAPEAYSFTFNPQGQATSVTGGYVIDNRLGNTNKLGALYGILQGIDIFVPHPQPGTLGWKVGIAVDSTVNFVKSTLHFLTLNIFKGGKAKSA